MILFDSDVAIDVLRGLPQAAAWYATLPQNEIIILPGYVAMEVIGGTRDSKDLRDTERWVAACKVVWIEPSLCERAYQTLAQVHLRNAIGVLDILIAQVAISLRLPLHTLNQKHFDVVPGLTTVRPYTR